MKKIAPLIMSTVMLLICSENMAIPDIRQPVVAGRFYNGDRAQLQKDIEDMLGKANPPKTGGMITGLIVPHAGYEYSGLVAAHGFKKLIGEKIDTVIIMGNSHHERFDGISIYPSGAFATPLGLVEIDEPLARAIMSESPRMVFNESAHSKEHSLEVELPFLQETLRGFKIVPVLFGNSGDQDHKILASAVVKHIKGKNVLVVASSDLSHYPSYKDAKISDGSVIKAVLTGNVQTLENTIRHIEAKKMPNEVTCACGEDAIKALMIIEKELGGTEIRLLKAANSGDVTGDMGRVVGYAAIGFFASRRGDLLNMSEQAKLLQIAKSSVISAVNGIRPQTQRPAEPMLNRNLGAFVTIRKNGNLRGCIGRFSPSDIPLYQAVSQAGVSAATQDPRFDPVSKRELPELSYEISVLSPLSRVGDWRDIVLGRDGVKIVRGPNSGVFLPQVADETGWKLEKFLSELCTQKAGLSPSCYTEPGTELYTFTAQVFGDRT